MAALEEDKVATPELKNEPVSTDVQTINDLANSEPLPDCSGENSESQLNTDISNSETQANEGLVASETQEEVNAGTLPNSEEPSSNHSMNPEDSLNNQQGNSEDSLNNQQGDSEPPLNNQQGDSEALPKNQQGDSEAPPKNQQGDSEALPKNQHGNSEAPPNNEQGDSEAPPTNQPYSSEALADDQLINSKENLTKQSDDSEAPPSGQLVSSEATLDEKSAPESPSSNEMVNSEVLANNDLVNSETQTSNEVVLSETQSGNVLVTSEIQPSSEVMSEAQPSSDMIMSETHPSNELVISETHPSNDVVMSEALPENDLANSIAHPSNQLSHTESLPDDQFTDPHMLPENQLSNSDTLPDNQLIDTKPIPDNHLAHFEALPNNHLAHSEPLSNNQLANSEALSHDHLANSQMLPQYELVNAETLHDNQLINSQTHYELVNSETLPSYEIVTAETQPDNEDHTPETHPNKRRKKKSVVWEHFTIETVSPGCRRACCKQCKQSFAYSTGSKVAGTSHLKRHIAKGTCPALQRNQGQNQLTPYTPRSRGSGAGTASDTPKRRYRSPNNSYMILNQDRCRQEIARMIIMHDYPLHMVEHPGFVAFVQNLQPQFNMVTFNTVQGDCVATYLMEKQNLMRYVDGLPGRVCLTLDMWTSSQSVGYVFITGHFVDSDWKLQKRILNVIMEPYPDSDSALSHAVAACLSDWSLEGRLFSITINQASTEVAHENLRPLLTVKNPLILNGQLLVGNCIARTLSNVARDLLASAQDIVKKIRDSVKYVKTSESHEEKFLELKQQLQVPSERTLFIDDQTQWNTSYQMLVAASELKEVFSCLDTSDPDYRGAPSMQDWKLVETLCTYLKPLFDAANILITTTHPPSIAIFHEVWKLQLDLARAIMSEDPFISNLTKIMQEKIDKYWRDCSLVLAIAVVMDPRFKMKLVEFSFPKIYGDDAHVYIKIVDDGIHELFHEYVNLPLPLTPAYAEDGGAGGMRMEESPGGILSDNGLTDFDMYIMETTSQHMKSELDQYLEESLLPRSADFDVLGWWKLNKLKYPTLSKMARDILTVPVSTVPAESVFDIKSKEMDQYRCSLRPETVEALVCAKDWMQSGTAETSNALVKMEF